jgi:hypothetical protein
MAMIRPARWSQAPRWLTLVVGMGSMLIGALLVTQLFRSLAVLTLASGLVVALANPPPAPRRVIAWIHLVLPEPQAASVEAHCLAVGRVDYRTYPSFEHVDMVGAKSPLTPDLLA